LEDKNRFSFIDLAEGGDINCQTHLASKGKRLEKVYKVSFIAVTTVHVNTYVKEVR
jgi:hypothetical protein